MRIKGLRKALWAVNTLLVLGIVAYALSYFILGGAAKRGARSAREILGRLPTSLRGDIKPDLLPASAFRFVHEMTIDGDPPVEVVDEGPGEVEEGPLDPIARNWDLQWTKVSAADPIDGVAHFTRKNSAPDADPVNKRVGEVLDGWTLVEVGVDTATFLNEGTGDKATLEAQREGGNELAAPAAEDGGKTGTVIGPGVPRTEKPPRDKPVRVAVEVSKNVWEVPPEEARWWDAWGEEEMEGIAVQPAPDPVTKKSRGILIKSIPKGSIASRRGLRQDDIVKSINGHPVRSKAEAIAYVKGEGKGASRYVIVIERNGRDEKYTYNVRDR